MKNCPHCSTILELIYEEVDIGVGVQRHQTGAECPSCGAAFTCCFYCGVLDFEAHQAWCADLREGVVT